MRDASVRPSVVAARIRDDRVAAAARCDASVLSKRMIDSMSWDADAADERVRSFALVCLVWPFLCLFYTRERRTYYSLLVCTFCRRPSETVDHRDPRFIDPRRHNETSSL